MTTEKKLEYAKNALECLDSDQLDLIVNMIRTMKPKLYDYRVINRFVPFDGGYYPIHTLPSSNSYSLKEHDTIVGIMLDHIHAIDHNHGGSIVPPANVIITSNRWLSLGDTQCFVDEGYYLDRKSVPVLERMRNDQTKNPFYMIMTPAGFFNAKKDLEINHVVLVSMVHDTKKAKNTMLSATITQVQYEPGESPGQNPISSLRLSDGLELKDISISLLVRSPRNARLLDDPREWN